MNMIPTKSMPLSRRLLSSFAQWRNLDAAGRKRGMPGVSDGERAALETLERNFAMAGAPERWFHGSGQFDVGKLAILLAGFTLTAEAIPDLVRASRLSGFQAGLLKRELERWLKDGQHRAVVTALNSPGLPESSVTPAPRGKEAAIPRIDMSAASKLAAPAANPESAAEDPFTADESLGAPGAGVPGARGDYVATMEQTAVFAAPLIGPESGASLQEQVWKWCGHLKVDLTQKVPAEALEEIAGRIGGKITPRGVRDAIQRLRAERGIRLVELIQREAAKKGERVVISQQTITERVEEVITSWKWDLSRPLPNGATQQLAATLGIDVAAAQRALHRLRDQRGEKTRTIDSEGAFITAVEQLVVEWGWDLQRLPRGYSVKLAEHLGSTINQVSKVVCTLRGRAGMVVDGSGTSLTDQVERHALALGWDLLAPPPDAVAILVARMQLRPTSVGCALFRARKRAEKAAASAPAPEAPETLEAAEPVALPAPAMAATPEPAPARVVDDARALGLKLASKLADLNDREALLKAVSIWERVQG